MIITDMENIRAALANAMAEGMTLLDVYLCAEHAETTKDFDAAVNELAQTIPTEQAE